MNDRDQRDMDIQEVVLSGPSPQLSHRLNERRALNITNRTTQLNNTDIRLLVRIVNWNTSDTLDPILDCVRKMRNDLHSAAEVVTSSLLLNDMLIDLAGRDVVLARERDVQVAFVVAEIEINFAAVVENEDFAVSDKVLRQSCPPSFCSEARHILSRRHGSRINVHVRIDLDRGDLETQGLEQQAGRRGFTSPMVISSLFLVSDRRVWKRMKVRARNRKEESIPRTPFPMPLMTPN